MSLLFGRYTLSFPTNPDKVHPVYGSHLATSFYEWAFKLVNYEINRTNAKKEIFISGYVYLIF